MSSIELITLLDSNHTGRQILGMMFKSFAFQTWTSRLMYTMQKESSWPNCQTNLSPQSPQLQLFILNWIGLLARQVQESYAFGCHQTFKVLGTWLVSYFSSLLARDLMVSWHLIEGLYVSGAKLEKVELVQSFVQTTSFPLFQMTL